ncbi:MAG TPA: TIM barrel protein [Vicinamibacterales bacterium]
MSDMQRREFLSLLAAAPIAWRLNAAAAQAFTIGYAAITWGGDDPKAIEDVSAVGFKGIQLRASAFDRWGKTPADLKALLKTHTLAFPVLSSGNLNYQAADVAANIDMHLEHAKFVRDAGGQRIQVIDEKPKGRVVTTDDYKRLADAMNTLGAKTNALGVPLVYHHHMNSTGEPPAAIEAILSQCDAASVGLLFDIAHYQQGGGDPVAFIQQHGNAIKVVHLKDVRIVNEAPGYQWVELGRGRVDVKGCVAALKAIGFSGWAIVELDKVVDANGTPKTSAETNKAYVTSQLGLTL